MPRDQHALRKRNAAEHEQTEYCQQKNAGKGKVGAQITGLDLDIEAKALIAADKLGDRRTDGRSSLVECVCA